MFTAKAKAKQRSLNQIRKKAAKNLAADPDGFVKAVSDVAFFSLEIFQKQAEFIIKYTSENPDKPLPPLMKNFEKEYRNGPLKILHQQIESIARIKLQRKEVDDMRDKSDKDIADMRDKSDKDIAARRAEIDKIRKNT